MMKLLSIMVVSGALVAGLVIGTTLQPLRAQQPPPYSVLAPDAHSNFGYSTVAIAPSPPESGTSLTVQPGDGVLFPTPPFNASVWPYGDLALASNAEIVRITAISGDTFTIARRQERSAVRQIQVSDQIAATITVKTFTDIELAIWRTRNLAIENDGVHPESTVRVTADEITVEDTLVAGLNLTADIAGSGANGLDVGLKTPNTWYAIWLIYNPTTTTAASLLSTSTTGPTIPAGFTKKRRVGMVRTDANGNFLHFRQAGDFVMYEESLPALTKGNATVFTPVDCAAFVPPTSRRAYVSAFQGTSSGNVAVRRTGSKGSGFEISSSGTSAGAGRVFTFINLDTSQRFDYRVGNGTTAPTFYVHGYIDPVL